MTDIHPNRHKIHFWSQTTYKGEVETIHQVLYFSKTNWLLDTEAVSSEFMNKILLINSPCTSWTNSSYTSVQSELTAPCLFTRYKANETSLLLIAVHRILGGEQLMLVNLACQN